MRFPRIHLATSTVNRIMNLTRDMKVTPTSPPLLPAVAVQGAQLDQALAQPVQAVPAPAGTDTDAIASTLEGGTAAEAVQTAGVMDALA